MQFKNSPDVIDFPQADILRQENKFWCIEIVFYGK
jgi:hypothetical protein